MINEITDGFGVDEIDINSIKWHIVERIRASAEDVSAYIKTDEYEPMTLFQRLLYVFGLFSKVSKKPVFVSPGHRISLETSLDVAKHFSVSKIPQPLIKAHVLAKNQLNKRG